MKTKIVNETLNEFIDTEADLNDENSIIPEEIEFEDELGMENRFESAIKNELNVPEHSRRNISFRVRGSSEIIDAVPMARMGNNSFLMKIGDKYKKFNMNDIIEESFSVDENFYPTSSFFRNIEQDNKFDFLSKSRIKYPSEYDEHGPKDEKFSRILSILDYNNIDLDEGYGFEDGKYYIKNIDAVFDYLNSNILTLGIKNLEKSLEFDHVTFIL